MLKLQACEQLSKHVSDHGIHRTVDRNDFVFIDSELNEVILNVNMLCVQMEFVIHGEHDSALIVTHEWSWKSDSYVNFAETYCL